MSSFRDMHGLRAATGDGGSGRGGRRRGEPPSLMDPERRRDPHRILALFAPYRVRLAAVMGLIVFASGLGVISPFLLKAVLDTALPERNGPLLTELVLGMIGISIATAAITVWQKYISNVVGQRVMHDLRAAVYRHLQRMSLAFFTRTRTGGSTTVHSSQPTRSRRSAPLGFRPRDLSARVASSMIGM